MRNSYQLVLSSLILFNYICIVRSLSSIAPPPHTESSESGPWILPTVSTVLRRILHLSKQCVRIHDQALDRGESTATSVSVKPTLLAVPSFERIPRRCRVLRCRFVRSTALLLRLCHRLRAAFDRWCCGVRVSHDARVHKHGPPPAPLSHTGSYSHVYTATALVHLSCYLALTVTIISADVRTCDCGCHKVDNINLCLVEGGPSA